MVKQNSSDSQFAASVRSIFTVESHLTKVNILIYDDDIKVKLRPKLK
jgi:hypothetical protein